VGERGAVVGGEGMSSVKLNIHRCASSFRCSCSLVCLSLVMGNNSVLISDIQ